MKTKFIVMAAMAAMFSMGFTACSNNDEDLAGKEAIAQARGIGFDVKASGMNATRGDATAPGNIQFTDFQTWAYDASTNLLYMGDNATTGRTVTFDAGVWGYTPQQFWPVNELNFVSIAPAAAASSNSTAASTGVVTLTSNLVIGTDVTAQNDIMFACGKDNSGTPVKGPVAKDDHAGDVPLVFEHALSQIVFKGKLPASGAVTEVEIAEISLGNIGSTGTVNFTSAGTWFNGTDAYIPTTVPTKYTLLAANLEESHFGISTANGDAVGGTTADTPFNLTVSNSASKHNAWFLLPQRTAAWEYRADPSAAATDADKLKLKAGGLWDASANAGAGANVEPNSGAYLKIRATLKKDGVTILGSAESDAIYIPIDANWDRSKKYTYIIEFNGLSALTPITFSVTAEPWTEAADTDLQM